MNNNKGQTTMEYVVISALVGILCITAVAAYGRKVRDKITQMGTAIERVHVEQPDIGTIFR